MTDANSSPDGLQLAVANMRPTVERLYAGLPSRSRAEALFQLVDELILRAVAELQQAELSDGDQLPSRLRPLLHGYLLLEYPELFERVNGMVRPKG